MGDQVAALKQVVALSRPGAMLVGFQIGVTKAKPIENHYRHDPESFRRIWDQVENETGTEWSCEAQLKTHEEIGWDQKDFKHLREDSRVIQFVVSRTDTATRSR